MNTPNTLRRIVLFAAIFATLTAIAAEPDIQTAPAKRPLTAEEFQSIALTWIGTASVVLTALVTTLATLWQRVRDLNARQDRQSQKTGSLQEQVTNIAHNSLPPAANAPAPIAATAAQTISTIEREKRTGGLLG